MSVRSLAPLLGLVLILGLLAAPPAAGDRGPKAEVSSSIVKLGSLPAGVTVPSSLVRPQGRVAPMTVSDSELEFARQELDDSVAIAAVISPEGAPGQVWVRTVQDEVAGEWEAVEFDEPADAGERTVSTVPVVVSGADAVEVVATAAPETTTLQVFGSSVTSVDATASDLAWENPRILSRRAWQADESLVRYGYTRAEVTGAMIHHTAGTNNYGADQVPALLRSIQAYHVNGRGWNDMAYNVLVDRFGRAWEGRGGGVNQPIAGGHAWQETNRRTFGISLMGNYDVVRPPAAMIETMNQVIAWKLQMHGVDPYGATWGSGGQDGGSIHLPAISGHRDENATACPGRYVYEQFGSIRARVKALMDSVRYPRFRDVPPGMAFEQEIRWLADRNVSTGWTDGTYRPLEPISREAMAAFLYRLSGSPEFEIPGQSRFSDVNPGDPFYTEIAWLTATGITTGWDDGTFRPAAPITRDAMAAYVHRLYGAPAFTLRKTPDMPFTDVPSGTQFEDEIAWLAANGISTGWKVGGGAEYRPVDPVNRDAMAAFMHRAVDTFGEPDPVLKPAR